MKRLIMAVIMSLAGAASMTDLAAKNTEEPILPDGTYLYAEKEGNSLYMDVYHPAAGSETTIGGKEKPTVIFMFGGGFIDGRRDKESYLPWFRMMTDNGYRIISIDYRLGLKGTTKVGIAQVNQLDRAIHMAVEDLFSATLYIMDNAESLATDPENMVISGSSAGAISVLQAEYEICNRTSYAAMLPAGFNYAGVMSFSGAVLSREGKLKFKDNPAPVLMFHGTIDNIVTYKQIKLFKTGFFGSDKIVERFMKFGFDNYKIYRFINHSHEIATTMDITTRFQYDFLENNVMKGTKEVIDAYIDDPDIPLWEGDLDDMYADQ